MEIENNPLKFLFLLSLLLLVGLVGCSTESSEPEEVDPNQVTDIVWEWEKVRLQPGSETTEIPDPENYTLILREDGTFSGTADCNQFSGTYTNEGGYSFTLGPSTMAFCGEDSLDQQYLDLLSRVVTGGPDGGGGFALETAGSGERMTFRNGGAAPPA